MSVYQLYLSIHPSMSVCSIRRKSGC